MKVVSYKLPFESITELTLSGLTDHEDMDGEMLELSAANGSYLLHSDGGNTYYPTYKHETGEFYLITLGFNAELTLADRTYRCPFCGYTINRDLNAALNLRKEGLKIYTVGHTGSACGAAR